MTVTRPWALGSATVLGLVIAFPWGAAREAEARACPEGMVSIDDRYCIDAYEAATDEIAGPRKGKKKPKSLRRHAHNKPVTGVDVMAISKKGRKPQGYISRDEAQAACENAGKRLCTDEEWITACKGKRPTTYPYGDEHQDGACNDRGTSSFNLLFGPGNNVPPDQSAYNNENMNDPRLNAMDDTVAPSGAFKKCKNAYKVYDMVGNLHEWTSSKSGTFRGGYYLDTEINGEGCNYRTTAHDAKYHDYSTGFRCCYGGEEQKKVDAERKKLAEAEAEKKADEKAKAKAEADKKKAKDKKAEKKGDKAKKGEKKSAVAKGKSDAKASAAPVPVAKPAPIDDDPYGG